MADTWDLVHDERTALIDDLQQISAESWFRPSLCGEWTVHDVAAHLVNNARTTRIGFIVTLATARFDFDRQNARGVERERGGTPQETLARLRSVASRRSGPPAPLDTRLVEEVLHGEDIRRPLGISHRYPEEAVVRALRVQARTAVPVGGAKEHLSGLRLVATDADVSMGQGHDVSGPVLSLLLAISGRRTALNELDGPGVLTLGGRV